MIHILKVVKIHFVIPDDDGELFDAHTHGLEAFGHPEFQVLVPGFCRGVAGSEVAGSQRIRGPRSTRAQLRSP